MDSVISDDFEKLAFIDPSGNIINKSTSEELAGIFDGIFRSSQTDLVNYTGSLGEYFSHE
jgi:hypothetical protein